MPKRISFDDAAQLVDLRALLPAYDEDQDVVVLEPGKHGPDAVDLDDASYLVVGDLEIDGDLTGSDEGGFLVVTGNLRADSVLVGGPIVHVGGSLTVAHAVHTDYNHGELTVAGDLHAKIVAAEHLLTIHGTLDCPTTIDFGGLRVVSDPAFSPTLTRQQAARESKTHLVADVLNEQGYVDGRALAAYLANGGDPLLHR